MIAGVLPLVAYVGYCNLREAGVYRSYRECLKAAVKEWRKE